MASPSLVSLPRELIDHICSFFDIPADALILSSTCKTLRAALSSNNGQVWYRFLSHDKEISDIINKYKSSYKQDDFKPLAAIVPLHISEPLRKYVEEYCRIFDQRGFTLWMCEKNHGLDYQAHAKDHLNYLCYSDAYIDLSGEVIYKDWENHPNFLERPFGKYNNKFDYRRMVISTLLGRSNIPRCRVCMRPLGLLPEMWSVKLKFEAKHVYKSLFRDQEYVFCKGCLSERLICCDNEKFLGIDMSKFPRADPPKIQSQVSHLRYLLDRARNIFKGLYAGNDPRDYTPFMTMALGPVDFLKTILSDSVYGYFMDMPYENQDILEFIHGLNWPRPARDIYKSPTKLYFLSAVEKAVKRDSGSSLEHHRLNKKHKLNRLGDVMEEVYRRMLKDITAEEPKMIPVFVKERGFFDSTAVKNFLAEQLKTFLNAQNLREERHSNTIQNTNRYEVQMVTRASSRAVGSWDERETFDHSINIFNVLDFSLPHDASRKHKASQRHYDYENNLDSWISKSASTIISLFFTDISLALPILPHAPINKTVNSWIWQFSTAKFSKWQCNKAGLCKYCSDNAYIFYTPYTYAIHLYLHHREEFFEDKYFWWKYSKGEGITHVVRIVKECNWTYNRGSTVYSTHQREYGPWCSWSSGVVTDKWDYYQLDVYYGC